MNISCHQIVLMAENPLKNAKNPPKDCKNMVGGAAVLKAPSSGEKGKGARSYLSE